MTLTLALQFDHIYHNVLLPNNYSKQRLKENRASQYRYPKGEEKSFPVESSGKQPSASILDLSNRVVTMKAHLGPNGDNMYS